MYLKMYQIQTDCFGSRRIHTDINGQMRVQFRLLRRIRSRWNYFPGSPIARGPHTIDPIRVERTWGFDVCG